MAHSINKDLCIGCGVCEETCPLGAITADADGKREINADVCVDCGSCAGACPVEAISGEFYVVKKAPRGIAQGFFPHLLLSKRWGLCGFFPCLFVGKCPDRCLSRGD